MLSFFRRKKPQPPAEAAKPGATEGAYSIEELAAAFPAPLDDQASEPAASGLPAPADVAGPGPAPAPNP